MEHMIDWWGFITIISVTLGISSLVYRMIPRRFKEKPTYHYNKYARYVFSKDVTTALIVKSINMENIKADEFKTKLKTKLTDAYEDIRENNNCFSFNVKNGSQEIEIKMDIITKDDENIDDEYVEQLECTFKIKCKTSNLKSNIINYMDILMHLKDNLNNIDIHLNEQFVLSCELNSLDKINKILDLGKLDFISGSNDNINIELYKDKILIQGKNFNNEFVKIVDDVMINYA